MKRLFLSYIMFFITLAFCFNAQALTTTQTLDGSTNSQWFLPDGYDPYPGDLDFQRILPGANGINAYYRGYSEDWGWTHSVTFDTTSPFTILSATLSIESWDVDTSGGNDCLRPDEIDIIKVGTSNGSGGVSLGNLEGNNKTWSTTTFTLDSEALSKLVINDNTGTLQVWIDISSLEHTNGYSWDYWFVTLKSSTLTVNYIPVPYPIILGSLGVFIVGWLRKYRAI